ncbi:MAG: hypothetical protein H8E21_13625 [Gammaproteobacteria bacterium]|nr:hypothetical protein [Gammaproteobacteria bacterium]
MNPAISMVLQGQFADYKLNPEDYELPGFMLGGEAELAKEGFGLGHGELVISSNVDDKFFGKLTLAIAEHAGETEVELEEAYIETLALGSGFTVKAGRYFSNIGYLNSQHTHAWDFIDAPLIYRGLFGNQLIDDGIQLRWLAPTDLFIQIGVELGRGDRFPAGGASNDGKGAQAFFVELGGDVGTSHSWQLGLSHWSAKIAGRESGGHAHEGGEAEIPGYTGDSDVTGVDVVWKWAPDGNFAERNLKLQFEYFKREEVGSVELENSGPPVETTTYNGEQTGWYLQAVYQFMPQWRAGIRFDSLKSDNTGSDNNVLGEAGLDDEGHNPERTSIMIDYAHSEFSLLRLQFNRDDSYESADDQIYLQYVMSLGAHGAHQF